LQPNGGGYFLPGKVAGKAVTFLLDSGCNTNLLSKRVFDTLSPQERQNLTPYTGEPGTLADGSRIPFYGFIELAGRVCDQTVRETFVLSQLNEDAVLGMPFLKRHGCRMDFHKSAIQMAGNELACVDQFGRPLTGGVQVVRSYTIPGRSRANIHCRVNNRQLSGLGFVEGTHTRIKLANSLNQLTERGEILVQCVNPLPESVELPSGSLLDRFHTIQEEDIGPSLGEATEGPQQSSSVRRGTVPTHVQDLYQSACEGCTGNDERQAMAQLLREYADVFSSRDHDVSLTSAIHHEIPLAARTLPIRQPARRLGPEKDEEVRQQVHDLLDRDKVEPAQSA